MASILESTAVFEEKARGIGFTDAQLVQIKAQSITTLGDAAFIVALDAADASAKTNELAQRVFGEGVLPGVVGKFRYLLTLAQTLAAVDMKKSIEDDT
eukprot:6479044-Amphidinium_carterae.1